MRHTCDMKTNASTDAHGILSDAKESTSKKAGVDMSISGSHIDANLFNNNVLEEMSIVDGHNKK